MIEKVLKTGSKKVDHEDVVQTLLSEVVDIGDTSCRKRLANDVEKAPK